MAGSRLPNSVSEPLAVRVADSLREQIRSGRLRPGDWLPPERELAKEMGVYRRAVRDAIVTLEREGFLHREPRCRPRISSTEAAASRPRKHAQIDSSHLIALIMWHGDSSEHGKTAQQQIHWGMNQALAQAGYHGVFLDLGDDIGSEQENADREAARLRYALDNGFGGVIFYAYAYYQNAELVQEVASQVPLIVLDRKLPGIDADFVGIDNFQAMYDAAMHLIQQGHRRTMYITPTEPIHPVQDRIRGYFAAIHNAFGADIASGSVLAVSREDMGKTWPLFDAAFRLPRDERPTSILCSNDYEAVRVAERLSGLGLSVPDDVSVVGFDNKVATLVHGVGLTTVAQPYEELGRASAEAFLRRVKSPGLPPAHVELPVNLIVRESAGPPPTE
jgi:DNA-binding LacI/PurR family transcriptional regulator